jgi:prepilin-type N-terminal cleavage/methylation domain-containing protein
MLNLMSKKRGFTLLEMLLVLAIVSSMVVLGLNYLSQKTDELRRDRASMQYQQILNAGLAYNLSMSTWPTLAQLSANGFLPNLVQNNPWGNPYLVASVAVPNGGTLFYVFSLVPVGTAAQLAQAYTLAGRLPMAFTTTANPPDPTQACAVGGTCYVAAAVPAPGQNLNNARSVNFANLYHHGACVPAPACPANMTPEILTVPSEVAGVNDPTPPLPPNVYPISYFKAYALGGAGGLPVAAAAVPVCPGDNTACVISWPSPVGTYWRVCMQVVTSQGDVATTNPGAGANAWGQFETILAITRCVPGSPTTTEPTGSNFSVFTK